MRAAPAKDMQIVLKHQEADANAQVMYVTSIDDKNKTVDAAWISKDGVPYKTTLSQGMVEKYNPHRCEK